MKKYLEDMKNAMLAFKSAKEKADNRLEEIIKLYGTDARNMEEPRLREALKKEKEQAKTAIENAFEAGVRQAKEWGELKGASLTDDIQLLNADLVEADMFEVLKARHRDNAAMQTALLKYGQKKGYNVHDIVTVDSKIASCTAHKKNALNILDMIDGSGSFSDSWGNAFGRAMLPAVLDDFGQNEQ